MNLTKEKHATHISGPWHAYQSRKNVHRDIASHDGSKIAKEVHHANARLIAAAPEMYEVLQELAESMELAKNYGYEKEHAMIQEVLAKVEGGEG
tara:strand:+ start:618 stop:899 length:282 start_codon:yes stop_codon:yes gene_type:complete